MPGPLTSLKILDFSTLLPGPFSTMLLADLGADVLRVVAPAQAAAPPMPPLVSDDLGAVEATLNRSKRSMCLDLKHPAAFEIVARLLEDYDIVLTQFRPGVAERLGIGYQDLKAHKPALIYCALSGYGQSGPLAQRAGHDINYLARSGVMSYTGTAESGPSLFGIQVADVSGSLFVVAGILAAVIHRQQTGEGQFVDVSMTDGAIALAALIGAEYLASGNTPARQSHWLNGGSFYDYYRTADGRYLAVGSLEEKFWRGLYAVLERPDLAELHAQPDPDWAAIRAGIAACIESETLDTWMERFDGQDICVDPVLNLDEVAAAEQTVERGMIVEVPGPHGPLRQFANPLKFSRTPPEYQHHGPPPGQDTLSVLAEIGYTDKEIKALTQDGLCGTA